MRIQPDERQNKILDERTAWFCEAVTLTAGMTTRTPEKGQVYLGVQKDSNGKWLQGGNNYTLRVPPNPPASWSVLVRLYGPLEPWFEKTWKPGDIELVK